VNDTLITLHLMNAKLCHDISAPINAMGLGMEMLEGAKSLDESTKEILASSLESTCFKLNLYRLIMTTSPDGPSFAEVKAQLTPYFKSKNIVGSFDSALDQMPESIAGRILLGFGYIAGESLTRGGNVSFAPKSTDCITVNVSGKVAQLRPGYEETFMNSVSLNDQTARTIFPYYLKMLAKETSLEVKCESVSPQEYKLMLVSC
jgi:hypothetical protein